MRFNPAERRVLFLATLSLMLGACSTQKEPARRMLGDIDAALQTASADAAQYVPDQLAEVQKKRGELQASYDRKDYSSVVGEAPPVLSAAQGLESAATARRDEITKGFNLEWTGMATTLPGDASAIQNRITFLSQKKHRMLATGVDLESAESSLNDANTLWSRAQADYTAGHLQDAVTTAKSVKSKLDALAASMKLDLSQPAAVRDTAS
jgi:hypothetical protein